MVTQLCTIQDVDDLFIVTIPAQITDTIKNNLINARSEFIKDQLGEAGSTSNESHVQACAHYVAADIANVIYPDNSAVSDNYEKKADMLIGKAKSEKLGDVFID